MAAQVPLEQRQAIDHDSISLSLDKPFYALGQRMQGQVQVNLKESTRVKALGIFFQGVEKTHWRFGKAFYQGKNDVFGKAWSLASEATLQAGSTTYPFYFDIPAEAPPSYSGKQASVEWWISCRAEIGWRQDLSQDFTLRIVKTVSTPVSPVAVENPEAQPRIRVELSSNVYQPGETVEGKIILIDPEKMKEKGVGLGLALYERVTDKTSATGFKEKINTAITIGNPMECSRDSLVSAREVPFQVQLPPQAACSYTGAISSVDWNLGVSIDMPFLRGIHFAVPFTVGYKAQPVS